MASTWDMTWDMMLLPGEFLAVWVRQADWGAKVKLVSCPGCCAALCDALLIRGPRFRKASMGPGSAEQRKERCTASGTRDAASSLSRLRGWEESHRRGHRA